MRRHLSLHEGLVGVGHVDVGRAVESVVQNMQAVDSVEVKVEGMIAITLCNF